MIRRMIWLLVAVMGMSIQAEAQQNRIVVPDMDVQYGQARLPVSVENNDDVVAVQFDLTLPEGVVADQEGSMSNRGEDHEVGIWDLGNQVYRVMVFSATNRPLKGRTGVAFYLPVTIPESLPEGSVYDLTIAKAVLSKASGENIINEASAGKLRIALLPDLVPQTVSVQSTGLMPGATIDVSWTVANVGELGTEGGWTEQLSLVSGDGELTKLIATTRYDGKLSAKGTVSRQATIALPALLGIDGEARLQIQIVPDADCGEKPSAQANNTVLGTQILTVGKLLTLELSPLRVDESSSQRIMAKVSRSGRWEQLESFNLSATNDGRLSVPETIDIPAGQSGSIIYLKIADNNVLDPDSVVDLAVSGNGYAAVTQRLMIIDDEYPDLYVTASKSTVGEGDTFQLTVTTQRLSPSPIEVTLTSEHSKRFTFPQTMTIPANEPSASVEVEVVDDDIPSLTVSSAFTASAARHNSGEAIVMLEDNDVPAISLSLSPVTLSESAGPVAMIAVLRRTSNTDKDITVKLSDDSSGHDINYGQFSSITMAKNVEEVTFSLGINDNLIVDGDRDVTITAAVYIQSCSCSASGENAGVVSQTVHIIDNDGPSITLTSNRSMLLEGEENGTVLTVKRNTSLAEALTVNIISNHEQGLNYAHTVVIPAGQSSASVPVQALANMTSGDSFTVTFTATAEGHSAGLCWVMVSDQTLPDAVISSLELLTDDGEPIGDEGVLTGSKVQVRLTVENIGVVDLPAGTIVTLYQNGKRVTTLTTQAPIAPGESTDMAYVLLIPDQIGTCSVYAKVNEDHVVNELIDANNTSVTTTVGVRASFIATVSVDKSVMLYGDSVTVSGRITRPDGSAWQGDESRTVNVYFIIEGQRYFQNVTTDENGMFTYVWTPSRSHMGHVSIGACYPGETLRNEMAAVDIYGMRRTSNATPTFYPILEQPYTGTVTLFNPGQLPLTGLTVNVTDNPDEATITFDSPETIPAGGQVDIQYTLTGHKIATSNDWLTLTFVMQTAQGPSISQTLYYFTRNMEAQLSCSVQQINTTMTKGTTRDYSFLVANIGQGSTGIVSLALPDWMQCVTPRQMAPLAQGDTTQVIIRFVPTDDMQTNIPVTGRIGINCENGNGLAVPFRIEPVSDITGTLVVDVCDEFTYYTQEAPHVSGATVTLQHPVTGAVLASGITQDDGHFSATLPEGYYDLVVTHPSHHSYKATILLDPGATTYKVIDLGCDAIEVSWEVEETTVEDVYEIVTTVRFETNVPVPQVKVTMPNDVPAKQLSPGESLVFYAVLTNVGLITAEDVTFEMPSGFSALVFEQLDYNEPFNLAPQQSVLIPIKVTNGTGSASARIRRIANVDDDPCYAQFPLSWFWECGTDRKWHKYPTGLRVGDCTGKESVGGGGGDGFGSGGFGTGGGGGGGGGVGRPCYPSLHIDSDYSKKKVSTGEPYECEPCSNSAFMAMAKMIPFVGGIFRAAEIAKDVYNCVGSFKEESGWHDKLAGCKYTKGAVDVYDNYVETVNDIFDDLDQIVDCSGKIAHNITEKKFFTNDCLENWKDLFGAVYQTGKDAGSLAAQSVNIANKISDVSDKVTGWYDSAKADEDYYLKEKDRVFYYSSDLTDEKLKDRIASGESSLSREAWERSYREHMEECYQYAETEIATAENYKSALKDAKTVFIDKKDPGIPETRRMLQNGVRVLGQALWNTHNFTEMAKTHSVTQQTQLKTAYLDTTNKLAEEAGHLAELVHYTFGECEYEGDEQPQQADEGGEPQNDEGQNARQHGPKKSMSISFGPKIPAQYRIMLEKINEALAIIELQRDEMLEYYGSEAFLDLDDYQMAPIAWAMDNVAAATDPIAAIENPYIEIFCPDGITVDMLRQFLYRWYASRNGTAGARRNEPGGNVMDIQRLEELNQSILENLNSLLSGQEGHSVEEVLTDKFYEAQDALTGRVNSVCASITLQFNQTMTMTRQAFRGTLKVHNGNANGAMEHVVLQLEVRNANDGSLATSHEMQVNAESLSGFVGPLNLTDGWTLAPSGDGTATILFIPSKYAAPTEPVDYTFGGRLVYLDPYTGLEVTRELSPVTLTVKPSPELDLTYFMQRDVYGDDPLTLDVVEPMKEAEFALLINNKGYGDATNVRMVTQQPKIIDNEKGLLVNFELVSSQVNGGDATLSFGKDIANDFGTIPAHSQMYAQWWLTSTLLGHFTDYDVQATHVTSYGNPDLSLLDQVTIHELIHSITPVTSVSGGSPAGRAFLVNDIPDTENLPDMLYLTNGDIAPVAVSTQAQINKVSQTEYTLTVTPSATGWNYGCLVDPTYGMSAIKSVVRQSDGLQLPVQNFWQTDRTLLDGKEWLYENRIHFVDAFTEAKTETFVLTFDPLPEVILEVASFEGVPDEDVVAFHPVDQVTVTFNKAVDPETFTSDDLTLMVQGERRDVSLVGIQTDDNRTFALDLQTLTPQCPNGYYVLTVQTAGITDYEGFNGRVGKSTSWLMYRDGLVRFLTSAWPKNAGSVSRNDAAGGEPLEPTRRFSLPSLSQIAPLEESAPYGSTVTLVAEPETGYEFSNWTLNGEVVSTDPQLEILANGDLNVVANFKKKKYSVNVIVHESRGYIESGGTGVYEHGTKLILKAIALGDNEFKCWKVTSDLSPQPSDLIISDTPILELTVDSPITVEAVFRLGYMNQTVQLAQGWNWLSSFFDTAVAIDGLSAIADRVLSQTAELIRDPQFGLVGGLTALEAGQAYKVSAPSANSYTFYGHLYPDDAALSLKKGWNWIACPSSNTMTLDVLTNAEDGDYITAQLGFAEFVDGTWQGTLPRLLPGSGYLYKSTTDKQLQFHLVETHQGAPGSRLLVCADSRVYGLSVDPHAYPNTMNIIAQIGFADLPTALDGSPDEYVILAYAGDELRGVSQCVADLHYLTVYGDAPVGITFIVQQLSTGETFLADQSLQFRSDVVGSRKSPFPINIGTVTGINHASDLRPQTSALYDLQGRRLHQLPADGGRLRKGVYIIGNKKTVVK